MSELLAEVRDTASSQDPWVGWLVCNSTGSLLFDLFDVNRRRWVDESERKVCQLDRYGLLIHEAETADNVDYGPLKIETSEEVALDLNRFKEQVASVLGELREVRAVYIFPHDDCYEVYTVLGTRDHRIRNRLFAKELAIHDLFPEALLDFKVSMSPTLPTSKDLPKNAIKCLSR